VNSEVQSIAAKTAENVMKEYATKRSAKFMKPKLNKALKTNYATSTLSDQAKAISRFITLPGTYGTVRVAQSYNAEATAVASPYVEFDVPFAVGTGAGPTLNLDQSLIFCFRNPLRSMIIYYPPVGAVNSTSYQFFGTNSHETFLPSVNWNLARNTENSDNLVLAPVRQTLHIPWAKPFNGPTWKPHGEQWFAGGMKEMPERYYWFDEGAVIEMVYQLQAQTQGQAQFTLTEFSELGVAMDVQTSEAESGVINGRTMIVNKSGYYAINILLDITDGQMTFGKYIVDFFNIQRLTYTIKSDKGVFGHQCMPDFVKNINAIDSIRVSAIGILFSNRAAFNFKSGSVTGIQVSEGTQWQEYIIDTPFDKIAGESGRTDMPAAKGLYGFMKPTKSTDLDFYDCFDIKDGNLYDAYWPIEDKPSFLALASSISDEPGRKAKYIISWGVEYLTRDTFRDRRISKSNPIEFDAAMLFMRDIDAWYENPLHIGNILKKLAGYAKSGFDFILENGPKALKIANFAKDVFTGNTAGAINDVAMSFPFG